MKATRRTALVLIVLIGIIGGFWVLTALSQRTEGPVGRILTTVGVALSEFESQITGLFRGPGREAHLGWFQPFRTDPSLLKNPDRILLGAFDNGLPQSFEGIAELEDSIRTTFPLIHFYAAWGDKSDQQFPRRLVQSIWNIGSVPVITWEPWLVDFENTLHSHLPLRDDRDKGGMASVARGDYDFYIDRWASDAAAFGKPLYLRFAHEMNDPYRYPWGPQNNSVPEFLAAWRHVVKRFRRANATNVLWVWSPHIAYDYYPFYPGDDVVDWVGTLVLNYGTVAFWSRWWSFEEIFGTKYDYLSALKKPIMIAELGSLTVGGDRAVWYRDALTDLPLRYPLVKSVLFFHNHGDATVTYQQLDWSFARDPEIVSIVSELIGKWPSLGIGK